jgi:competence ComEA-like helix-hairpin-helix protein
MTNIPLRAYLREIEDAIEEGQLDEAVAHCRHILKKFPKHVDSYRLLGKAYLEAQKYGGAADIFERVLSSIPDDFVSHIGMSIIREDDGNLETAIWHMERAFETQPYNPAIQGEIKRLHGKRDGMEPAKARLTQGALARMYAKGGHYKQAIAEFRNVLAQDPSRPDLSVALAEAYAYNGDEFEAIQTCSTILIKLPFCMQANRLLVSLLEGTERQDERQNCLQRLYALDPYEAQVSNSAPEAEQVSDQAVALERYHWDGVSDVADEWSPNRGAGLEQQPTPEAGVPDWLASASEDAPDPSASEDSLFPEADSDSEEIPNWMKDAGWGASTEEFDEQAASLSLGNQDDKEAGEDSEAVEVNLPDWIQNMAPAAGAAAGAAGAATPDLFSDDDSNIEKNEDLFSDRQPEASSNDNLEWFQDIQGESPESPNGTQAESETLPDWLQDSADGIDGDEEKLEFNDDDSLEWLSGLQTETPSAESATPSDATSEDIPDWLQDSDDSDEEKLEFDDDDSLEWLSELQTETPSTESATPTDAASEDMPDWLQGVDEVKAESPISDDAEDTPVQSQSESGGVTDFLQGLRKDEQEDENKVSNSQSNDDLPEWLQGEEETPREAAPTQEVQSSQSQEVDSEVPDWLQDTVQEAPISASLADELQELPDEAGDEDATLKITLDSAESEGIPDWITDTPQETPSTTAEATDPSDGLPEWLSGDESEETESQAAAKPDDSDDIPDWLKTSETSVDAEATPASEAPTPTQEPVQPTAELTSDDMPEWLQGLEEVADKSIEEQVEAQANNELPDWLDNLAGDELPEEATLQAPASAQEMRESASQAVDAEDEGEIHFPSHEGIQPEASESQPDSTADLPEWLAEPGDQKPVSPDSSQVEEPTFPEWLAEPDGETEEDGAAPEFEDADAAMAWLEGLAAKQGVSEEELLSSPDERPDSPPEWTLTETPKPEAAPAAQDDILEWSEETSAEAVLPESESSSEAAEDELPEFETPEWLSDASADEKASTPPEPAEPEPQAAAGGEDDEIPDWLLDVSAEQEAPATSPEPVADPSQEQVPEWLQDTAMGEQPLESSSAEPEESAPDFEDADAAMAWLEGLAAKQGVSEDELLSSPDERPDVLPASLNEPPPYADAETEQVPTPIETETPAEFEAPAEMKLQEDAAAEDFPEWLRDGAFAPPGTPQAEPSPPTSEPQPAAEEAPEWLPDSAEEIGAGAAKTGEDEMWLKIDEDDLDFAVDEDKIPDWLAEMRAEESDAPQVEPEADEADEASEAMDKVPDWLKAEIEKEAAQDPDIPEDATWVREFGKDVPKFEIDSPQETPSEDGADDNLPEWLQDFDSDEQSSSTPLEEEAVQLKKEYTWQPAEELETDLPKEMLDLNEVSLIQMERMPNVGFSRAQIIFSHREENGPFQSFEELLELPGITPETVESIKNFVEIKAAPQPDVPVPEKAKVEAESPLQKASWTKPLIPIEEATDELHAKQIKAQQLISQGDVDEALTRYEFLIKKGKRLEEVIEDLVEASAQHPKSAEILQALGDAYMREDRLQEALDTYSKAEALLQ